MGRCNDFQSNSEAWLYFSIKLEMVIEGAQVKECVHIVSTFELSKLHWVTKMRKKMWIIKSQSTYDPDQENNIVKDTVETN